MTIPGRILLAFGIATVLAGLIRAGEPQEGAVPLCQRLKSNCVVAQYCPKSAPCTPCYGYKTNCLPYCKKAEPQSDCVCFQWCTSIYCKKSEPCYPADPCQRQVWHPAPCAPCSAVLAPVEESVALAPSQAAATGQRFAF